MSHSTDKHTEIETEAFAWLAQIESGDLSPADHAAFREWVGRSSRHRAEFDAAASLSKELGVLSELVEPLLIEQYEERRARRSHRLMRRFALPVAALVVAAVLATVMLNPGANRQFTEYYATRIGEYATVELPDDSSVKLNTNTSLEVQFDRNRRLLRLNEGEAYFEVAKDASRPFVVYAGDKEVRAIGTAFSVRLDRDRTQLIVTEGTVELSPRAPYGGSSEEASDTSVRNAAGPRVVEVTAGFKYTIPTSRSASETALPTKVSPQAQTRELSWTEGLFDFSASPLTDVIDEVSRHTTVDISIADPSIADLRFGGIFRIGDVDTLLEALSADGLYVEYVDEQTIRLHGGTPD